MSEKRTVYCGFCGKSQHEVRKIIAGPDTFICNECVTLCMTIVDEDERPKNTATAGEWHQSALDTLLADLDLAMATNMNDDASAPETERRARTVQRQAALWKAKQMLGGA